MLLLLLLLALAPSSSINNGISELYEVQEKVEEKWFGDAAMLSYAAGCSQSTMHKRLLYIASYLRNIVRHLQVSSSVLHGGIEVNGL